MTRQDFKFAENFPTLTDAQINSAYDIVSVMFSGVLQCWAVLPEPIKTQKRTLCINLILAWYLLDTNPQAAVGVLGNGGMALTSKSIGGTSLSFSDMDAQEGIKQLNSNVFGQKALTMIQSAPERFGIYA
ncbi:MAG: DUF4054 domain-containing protein [Spirochaetaceae bacterium]|nr:DUF4054 domain-containing protein [Spirochaetaceae bacterium]